MIEMGGDFMVVDLQIGEGGVAPRTPIDDVIPPVDEALFVQTHKDLSDRPRESFIHGKAFPAPVAGRA